MIFRAIFQSYSRLLLALLVFMLMLALYIHTLMPSTVGGDAGELQYAPPILALVHPTGLPLYIIVGHLWSKLIPIGTVAYRMNLLAAVSGALSAALMTGLVSRLYGRWIGLACGLTLALGATFWGQAVIADKYAFNALWVVLVIGLALWWAEDRHQPYGNKLLYALCLTYGISLLHHRTMILFAPWLAILVLSHLRGELWRNWRRTVICIALVILPALIVYPLVLPWLRNRDLSPSEWRPATLDEWVTWIMDRHEAREAFVASGIVPMLESYFRTMAHDYTVIVIGLAVLGITFMFYRRPASAQLLLFSFILQGGLAANWRRHDRAFTYFLPSFILLIYAYAYGLHFLHEWLQTRFTVPRQRQLILTTTALLMLGIPIFQFFQTYDLRYREKTYGYPLDLWRENLKSADMGDRLASGLDDVPPETILITDWEQVAILWYYKMVEGVRPDVDMVYPIERVDWYIDAGRPLCLSRHHPVPGDWHYTNVDALICISKEPKTALPDRAASIETELQNDAGEPVLELADYWSDSSVYEAGRFAPLVISWRALADIEQDYSVSLRILDEAWNPIWSYDIGAPVMGLYPTSRWSEGEVVQDYYELDIPPDMSPGRYLWAVVVYRALPDGTFENLRNDAGETLIYGGTFEVR